MDLASSHPSPVAKAIQLSIDAVRWERDATLATDADDRFSRRIQAEICRLGSAAALRDISR